MERWAPRLVAAAALLLVAAPLLTVVAASLRPGYTLPFEAGVWTLANFGSVFGDPFTYRLLLNTGLYAACSLGLGLGLALALAWLVERSDMPLAGWLATLLLFPLAIPTLLKAFAWVILLGPHQGILNILLRRLPGLDTGEGPLSIYTFGGMVFLTALAVVPSMFLMLSPLFRALDPVFEEAGEVSGASLFQRLRRILLPLVSPGILAVIIYFIIVMIEAFEIPLAIGLNAQFPVLSLEIYNLARGDELPEYGMAATYSFIGLALGIFLLHRYRRATARAERFAGITGKGYRRRPFRLGRLRYPALVLVALYLLLAVVLPVAVLLWTSLLEFYQFPSVSALAGVSLQNYAEIFRSPRIVGAALNTLTLFLVAASVTTGLALMVAWVVQRQRPRFAALLDNLVFLPLAVPSIVIALGVMLFYMRTPVWTTIWVIALGHIVRYLPFSARTIGAALIQIQAELEEAGWTSGASRLTTLRRITLPLLVPALGNAWLWVAIHSMRDFTFPLMLVSYSNVVITSLLWTLWEEADLTLMSSLAMLLILVSMVFTVASRRVISRAGF